MINFNDPREVRYQQLLDILDQVNYQIENADPEDTYYVDRLLQERVQARGELTRLNASFANSK